MIITERQIQTKLNKIFKNICNDKNIKIEYKRIGMNNNEVYEIYIKSKNAITVDSKYIKKQFDVFREKDPVLKKLFSIFYTIPVTDYDNPFDNINETDYLKAFILEISSISSIYIKTEEDVFINIADYTLISYKRFLKNIKQDLIKNLNCKIYSITADFSNSIIKFKIDGNYNQKEVVNYFLEKNFKIPSMYLENNTITCSYDKSIMNIDNRNKVIYMYNNKINNKNTVSLTV